MSFIAVTLRIAKILRISATARPFSALGLQGSSTSCYSTASLESDNDDAKNDEMGDVVDDILGGKLELEPQAQGVNPSRGWGFRGVHKAIICGKIGQAPVQNIFRNGQAITIFTVGTGGMYDQRLVAAKDLPKPAQWHRIAVHNERLGAYAVQQLAKDSSVYVEGDIETRVYNDSISGEIKNVPEICVRRDGKIRLIKAGESVNSISFKDQPLMSPTHLAQLMTGDPSYRIYCNNGKLESLSAEGLYYEILSILLQALISFVCRLFEEVREGSGCKGTLCCHYLKDVSMNAHGIRVRVGGCSTTVVDMMPEEPIDSSNYGFELHWIPRA